MSGAHGERKHSKYSASGAERWENCPGSVALSEGMPDKDSPWALEGTQAHEVLEQILTVSIQVGAHRVFYPKFDRKIPSEMIVHGTHAANLILGEWGSNPGSDILVETRIVLDWIHPEMFGTFDGAVIDPFGTLNVYDYKYGAGHAVSAADNMQMAFYAIGLAHKYGWNFKRVRMWIIQPRIRGYDGPTFWEVPTIELKTKWVDRLQRAVDRVEEQPDLFVEDTGSGKSWCHWCKAKKVCPLKTEKRFEKAKSIFTPVHTGEEKQHGSQEKEGPEAFKSEADWRKEAKARKGKARKESDAQAETSKTLRREGTNLVDDDPFGFL